jgi:SM-20-related protein
MQPASFEQLIDSYAHADIGVCANFLTAEITTALRAQLLHFYAADAMHTAGTGAQALVQTSKTAIRTDKIHWLKHDSAVAVETSFFGIMEEFVRYLNETCYTSITSFEFHYAMYEVGSFYLPHLDQIKLHNSRAFSMIHYLNENWQVNDGGELCVHHALDKQLIAPIAGTSVFFKSDKLLHEVLPTLVPRLSITGWLRTD